MLRFKKKKKKCIYKCWHLGTNQKGVQSKYQIFKSHIYCFEKKQLKITYGVQQSKLDTNLKCSQKTLTSNHSCLKNLQKYLSFVMVIPWPTGLFFKKNICILFFYNKYGLLVYQTHTFKKREISWSSDLSSKHAKIKQGLLSLPSMVSLVHSSRASWKSRHSGIAQKPHKTIFTQGPFSGILLNLLLIFHGLNNQ